MTDRGFSNLIKQLNDQGYQLIGEPDTRVHISMLHTLKSIYWKEPDLVSYEKLFAKDPEPGTQTVVDGLNRFMALALPILNAGKEPDVEKLAEQAGLIQNQQETY